MGTGAAAALGYGSAASRGLSERGVGARQTHIVPTPRRVYVLYYGLQRSTALAALMLRRCRPGAQVAHHLDGAQALGLVFRREVPSGRRQRLEHAHLNAVAV